MGTQVRVSTVTDTKAVLAVWNEKRRTLMIQNTDSILYVCFNQTVSENYYSFKLSPNGLFAIDNYGGIVTAIRESGASSVVYITEIQ